MEKVIDKIKKLMALEEGARQIGSFEEAANAAEKAQALLIKHNLSMSEVEGHVITSVGHTTLDASDFGYEKREGLWMPSLLSGLSVNNLCKCLIRKWGSEVRDFKVIGEPDNVEIVLQLFTNLVAMARTLERRSWNNYIGYEKRGKYRRGFLMGFAMGISKQLRESLQKLEQGDSSVTALVHVSSEAVDAYVDNNFKLAKPRNRSRGLSSNDGIAKGYNEGLKTKISTQKSIT